VKNRKSVEAVAILLDDTLRRVLWKIIETPSLRDIFGEVDSKKDPEDYFVSLVLGASSRGDKSSVRRDPGHASTTN